MRSAELSAYAAVWLVDFEFRAPPGERPTPLCLVAREFFSGRLIRTWIDSASRVDPPFDLGPRSLFVAYYSSAEWGCHLALGWPLPQRVLDLFVEFRNLTNGRPIPCGAGLLGALSFFGLDSIAAAEKTEMRELAMRGGAHSPAERCALLDYCQSDVDALAKLLPAMLPHIDLPRALLRGRYMRAAAHMESTGVPLDGPMFEAIRDNLDGIKSELTRRINLQYGVYVPSDRQPGVLSFSTKHFATWLVQQRIPWPRLPTGALALDDETFRQMARRYPEVAPLRELRYTLGQLRLSKLAVGSDGRNRVLLSAFRSRSGRNQPSNSKYIFGPATWLRSLIKPERGRALVCLDYSQQEFGIGARLSGDKNMQEAYCSGDPYLEFAKQAGAVPQDATKETHPHERGLFKVCVLGVQYGMGPEALADAIGEPPITGRELLRLHRQTYPDFWRWSQGAVDHALLYGWIQTVFGWRLQVTSDVNPRSLANFPCQANGAEMLRLACCLATERGIAVCAPIHDALVVEAPPRSVEQVAQRAREAMVEAAEIVLDGFPLQVDQKVIRWPDRYTDERGVRMWQTVVETLAARQPTWEGVDMNMGRHDPPVQYY